MKRQATDWGKLYAKQISEPKDTQVNVICILDEILEQTELGKIENVNKVQTLGNDNESICQGKLLEKNNILILTQ